MKDQEDYPPWYHVCPNVMQKWSKRKESKQRSGVHIFYMVEGEKNPCQRASTLYNACLSRYYTKYNISIFHAICQQDDKELLLSNT